MKILLRLLNLIVFSPFVLIGVLFLLWNNIDDRIVEKYKVKEEMK